MKKIFLFLIALSATLYASAQTVNVTYQVDVTHLIAGPHGPILPAGMRLAGTFDKSAAIGNAGFPMMDFSATDTSGKMTNISGNIWSLTVSFPDSAVGDSVLFKFIDGIWNGTANGTNEGVDSATLYTDGCADKDGGGNLNRRMLVPATNQTYTWCYDQCTNCDGSNALSTGVRNINNVSVFSLAPNPAVNKQSTLMYSVNEYSPVSVALYNVLGQSVKTFVNTNRPSGVYNQTIDLSGLNAGVYFIQLTSGSQTIAKKVVVE